MRERIFVWFITVALLAMVGSFVQHRVNCWAENGGQVRRDFVLSLQLSDFLLTGGGPLGPKENYFAWRYTKALDERRPWYSHVLFPRCLVYQPLGYWIGPEEDWHHPLLTPG